MPTILVAFCCLFIAGASFWGWGWMFERGLGRRPGRWPLTATLGLAVIVFLGGVLNDLRLARPWATDAVIAVGAMGAACGVASSRPRPRWRLGAFVPAVPWAAAAGFVAVCLVPASAYNLHDDLEKYFALVVRMLSTGTLAPNPLGSVGAETLGGQAWLDAFVAAHFPLNYLDAVDAWFCLVLFLAIVAFGRPSRGRGIAAAAAVAAGWLIDPLIVNVASVFSGAALIAAALFLGGEIGRDDANGREGLLLGFIYGALVALKPTYGVFVFVHLVTLALAGAWFGRRRRRWIGWAGAGTLLAVLPWLILHRSLYFTPAQISARIPPGPAADIGPFSRALSGYGTAEISYTMLALAALVVALVAIVRRRGDPAASSARIAIAAAGLTAGLAYFAFVLIGGPVVFGPFGATRYACPILIAAIPCLMRLLEPSRPEHSSGTDAAMVVVSAAIAALFWPATRRRPVQWFRDHTPLAYLAPATAYERDICVTYNRQVFDGLRRSTFEWLQSLVPAGEPLGAWVSTPFFFDFRRNPIYNTDPAGLSERWTHWPAGMRYFALEYQGLAVHTPARLQADTRSNLPIDRYTAVHALAFLQELRQRTKSASVLYDDGSLVLLRIN